MDVLVETSAHVQRRPRILPSRAALRELAIFAVAYLTCFGVRALTEGERWRAFRNALTVHRLEVDLGIDWEGVIHGSLLVSYGCLVDAAAG